MRTIYETNKNGKKLDNLSEGQLTIMDAIADIYESIEALSTSDNTSEKTE